MSDTVHIVKCNVLNSLQSQEIIALKDRITQLNEELIDVKNTHSVLVADVVLYEDRAERIKRLEEAGDALANNHNPFTFIDWLKAKEDKL